MVRDHKLTVTHITYRHLIASAIGVLIVLSVIGLGQAVLTEGAEADADEQEVTFMDVGAPLIETDGAASVNDDSADIFFETDPDGIEEDVLMDDEELDPDRGVGTGSAPDAVVFISPESPVDPGISEEEVIEAPKDGDSENSDQPRTIENVKLRSGGVSADPMEVLLGVIARHQQQGSTIRVISCDPTSGRVIYATD